MNWASKSLFAFLIAAQPAVAEETKCNSAGICVGDPVYYYSVNKLAHVKSFDGGYAKIRFEGSEKDDSVSANYISLAKEGACLKGFPNFCVGKYALKKDDWGPGQAVKILAVSTYGNVITVADGSVTQSYNTTSFDSETYTDPPKTASPGYLEKCAGDLCPGATGYAQLTYGNMTKVKVLGSNTRGDAVKVSAEGMGTKAVGVSQIAVDKSGACSKAKPEACVDLYANRRDGAGNMINAKVVGVYPHGAVVVEEKGKTQAYDATTFISFTKEPAPNTPPPPFVEKCLADICPGATGYFTSYEKVSKLKIMGTDEGGTMLRAEVEGQSGYQSISPAYITVDKEGECMPSRPDICVGVYGNRIDMKGNLASEMIVAVNPKRNTFVVSYDGKLYNRDYYSYTSFTKTPPPPFTPECVNKLCPGDEVYSLQSDRPVLSKVLGKVTNDYLKIQADGRDMESVAYNYAAVAKPGACHSSNKEACVGSYGITEVGGRS